MANEIAKFSLEDEKLLLSEMEMLEVYGGVASPSTNTVTNGCKCGPNCGASGSSSTKDTQVAVQCGTSGSLAGVQCGTSGSQTLGCSSGSSGSSGNGN